MPSAFLFPRVVTIYREPVALPAGRVAGYSGREAAKEAAVAGCVDLQCSIQAQKSSTANPPKLPSDTPRSGWFIFVPYEVAPPAGAIRQGDVAVDDLGARYTVTADYWTPMGYRLTVSKEEA